MVVSKLDKKLDYWEHQLLDLGKRNKMINYKETKRTTLKLVEPSFEELFDRIAMKEEELTFQRAVDKDTDIRVFSMLSLLENLSVALPVAIGDIKTEGSITERQKTLKNMRSKTRLALEEQGTNILYLSFGFIEWKDGKGASAQWIKSPLIMVPATLTLEALNAPFVIKKHEDDIVVNPTLSYYLKTEYGVELPEFDSEKETINSYLSRIELIADVRGWRIIKDVSLGLVSFLKISMYNDLLRNEERIKTNPIIQAMSGNNQEVNNIPENLVDFNLDSINTRDCYQVMSADSSQQDAILYSKNNISFVMQGPPGTGKSQTITNIIAEALADGKKVLFVSEKMAALQVVYRRLQEVHLGDFCLPLHSYKANKKEILEQIGANLSLKQTNVKDDAINNLDELFTTRKELNDYVSELHKIRQNLNHSCYEIYSKLENLKDVPSVTFEIKNILDFNQQKVQVLLNVLKEYSLAIKRLDYFVNNNPWEGLSTRTTGYEYNEKFKNELATAILSLSKLKGYIYNLGDNDDLFNNVEYQNLDKLQSLVKEISNLPQIPQIWLPDSTNIDNLLELANTGLMLNCEKYELEKNINLIFKPNINEFDTSKWLSNISANLEKIIKLTSNELNDEIIDECNEWLEKYISLEDSMKVVISNYKDLNNSFGLEYLPNNETIELINKINSLLEDKIVVPSEWVKKDITGLKTTAENATKIYNELKKVEENILANWEKETLSLDYVPILLRYKTDYTSFFKIFNSQYKKDKKTIQALSKTIIKKLDDNTAIDLLTKIKEYKDKIEWFKEKEKCLSENLSVYFNGLDSNWDLINKSITKLEKFRTLFNNEIPEKLVDIITDENQKNIVEIVSKSKELNNAFDSIKNLININQFDIDLNSTDKEFENKLAVVCSNRENLNNLCNTISEIKPYLVNCSEKYENILNGFNDIKSNKEISDELDSFESNFNSNFSNYFDFQNTDWNQLINVLLKFKEIKESKYYPYVESIINLDEENKNKLLNDNDILSNELENYKNTFEWLNKQFDEKSSLFEMPISALLNKLVECKNNFSMLEQWIDYQEAKDKCKEYELNDFIKEIEMKNYLLNVEDTFLKGFYQLWLSEIMNQSNSLRRFRRNVQDDQINKFNRLDDLQLLISQMRIREKLIKKLPSLNNQRLLKATDEMAILNKEMNKKRNIMPLRKLFKQIPNLLMRLKPCLMMSPLSVSYFLETEAYHFDLVIFDEASQIFPEDAIGAIFRGSQVIIAGDSKQLPPTNFFAATTNNSDGDYDIDDEQDFDDVVSDSILEESASTLPNRTLLWHYRSKDESLIAFSNREIYKNSLITFPNSSDNIPDMGVEYIYVEDGYYEGKGKNCNIREAQECVKLVKEHIDKYPNRSLGIIAFSEKQQTAIENEIIKFRETNAKYEFFFDESKEEPFFVKNLENVQGDERDTIIFSICYAKDIHGKMYMRFGPLGHEGGERRLNVAITRAKCNVKLVGSILPSDIDLNRTNSEGVRMLRSYIEFARYGIKTLKPVENKDNFDSNDEFCEVVVNFLVKNGYKVKQNIGCSDYKIDIAVEHPNIEGEYIAGIECDGLSYVKARTARDRDHLRGRVLQNMGWNLYRVWSTEWIRNPETEGQALLKFIQSNLSKSGNVIRKIKNSNEKEEKKLIKQISSETKKTVEKKTDNPYNFQYYQEADWRSTRYSEKRGYYDKVGDRIKHIVNIEQPIHKELLYKRMASSLYYEKVTEGVKREIDYVLLQKISGNFIVDEDSFVTLDTLGKIVPRIPKKHSTPRPIEYISKEEVAKAMMKIINSSFGLTKEDLSSECAKVFGFERKGPKIRMKMEESIKYLIDNNIIKIIDDKVQMIGE